MELKGPSLWTYSSWRSFLRQEDIHYISTKLNESLLLEFQLYIKTRLPEPCPVAFASSAAAFSRCAATPSHHGGL